MRMFYLLPVAVLFVFAVNVSAQDDEDAYMREYSRSKKMTGLTIGGGMGAKYGGWFGAGATFDFGYIGLSLGSGYLHPNTIVKNSLMNEETTSESYGTLGWQAGLRIYFAGIKESFRPGLDISVGNVYPYQINYSGYTSKGLFLGYTPSVIIEHDVGKPDGFSLSYGLGVVVHEAINAKDKELIKIVTKADETINLSLIFGVNYAIF